MSSAALPVDARSIEARSIEARSIEARSIEARSIEARAPRTDAAGATTLGARTRELRRGAMAMAPIAAGYAPFALLVGREAAASPEPVAGWAANFLVYGGSAQLSVSRLLTEGAALATVVLTGLLIQARLLVYSASLAPLWRHRPLWWRAAAAAVVIDPTWALMHARHARPGTDRELRAYFVGAVAALTSLWVVLVTAGMVLVTRIPTSATLDLVAPLALCALVMPQLRDRANLRAAIAAAAVVLAGTGLPTGLPILAAMAAGVLAGSLGGNRSRNEDSSDDNPKGGTQR